MDDIKLHNEKNFECKGLFYRLNFSSAISTRGYVFTIRFNKLKKFSCPGCPYCNNIQYSVEEEFSTHGNKYPISVDYKNLKDSSIYELVVSEWDYEPTDYDGYSPSAKIPISYEMRLRKDIIIHNGVKINS